MALVRTFIRLSFAICSFVLAFTAAHAQVGNVTDTEATPIAGAGHHYQGDLNETVNPANGSLSIRIAVPVPPGRGLTIPFAFEYDSNGFYPPLQAGLVPTQNPDLFKTGWSYSTPKLTYLNTSYKITYEGEPTICAYTTSYIFYDPRGGRHALDTSSNVGGTCTTLGFVNYPTGGDPVVSASNYGYTVQDASGNTYTLSGNKLSATVEDRNGNIVQFTDSGQNVGAFTATDTAGRTVLSATGLGHTGDTVTVSGLSTPYTMTWGTTATWNFNAGITLIDHPPSGTCNNLGTPALPPGSGAALSSLTLPDGQSYSFSYDPTYGTVSQITYPTGGWVKYTWGLNANSETASDNATSSNGQPDGSCYYLFGTPAVVKRQVSYDGVNVAEEQDFSYTTNWDTSPNNQWSTKVTNVATYDEVRSPSKGLESQITYTYNYVWIPAPPYAQGGLSTQFPVEKTVQYYDWTGTLLKTVNKTWDNQYLMASEQTVWPAIGSYPSSASQVNYTYGSLGVITEKDEYDYGQTTTPTRKTISNYQTFPANPLGSIIYDRPCQTIVEDGSNNHHSETDYFYDGTTSTTPCATATSQTLPGTGSYTSHDETNFGTSSTASRGNATKITKQCFVGSTACTNSTTTATYDETGQILTSVNACGNATCSDVTATSHTTTYSYLDNYDSPPSTATNAYLTKITNPLGQSGSLKYAYSDGQLLQSTDPNGLITQYAYNDSLRRLTSTTNPDGGQTTNSYNDAAPTPSTTISKQISSSKSLVTTSVMDGIGHITHTQLTSDPQGTVYTDTAYDGLGNVYTVSNPYRSCTADPTSSCGTTTYVYDGIGRKTSATYPDSSVLTTAYCGPWTLVTDPTTRWRRSRTDGLGRLVEVDEPNSTTATVTSNGCPGSNDPVWVTTYTLDQLNDLTNVLQNSTHARTFTYDSLSRLLTSTNPEVGTITYTYDAAGNVQTKTDARSVVITYGYEALNREVSASYSNGDPTITTTYDQSACLGLATCENIGHRTTRADGSGSEEWAYENVETSLSSERQNQRSINVGSGTITRINKEYFDAAGNITEQVYPSGRIVYYTYDAADRPSTAADSANGITYATGWETGSPTGCVATAVCYTPQGSFYGLSLGQTSSFTGVNVTNTYNTRLQPQEFKASSTAGNAIDVTYGYTDPVKGGNAGHVWSFTNNLDSTRSQTFTYDQLNRIVTAQTNSTYATSPAHCWGETYTLDAWANLNAITATTNANYTGCTEESGFSHTADGNNHLAGFTYDASGNTSSDTVYSTYLWNGESQLKSVNGVSYTYDGDGRRASKVGSKLYWYGAGDEILAETDTSGNTLNEYVFFGGKRIAILPASTTAQYYVEDSLGSSRIVTNNTGTVCYDGDFYPYGGERAYTDACTQNNYKFEGKERDIETGNDDFDARYYSNRFGRWLSADWSALPVAVPYANLTNPQTLNLYSMVADDPESFADLDGHCGEPNGEPCKDILSTPSSCSGTASPCVPLPPSPPKNQTQSMTANINSVDSYKGQAAVSATSTTQTWTTNQDGSKTYTETTTSVYYGINQEGAYLGATQQTSTTTISAAGQSNTDSGNPTTINMKQAIDTVGRDNADRAADLAQPSRAGETVRGINNTVKDHPVSVAVGSAATLAGATQIAKGRVWTGVVAMAGGLRILWCTAGGPGC
jgi:RHS repeat-associated protein